MTPEQEGWPWPLYIIGWPYLEGLYSTIRRLPRDDWRRLYYEEIRDEVEWEGFDGMYQHIAMSFLYFSLGWRLEGGKIITPGMCCPAA